MGRLLPQDVVTATWLMRLWHYDWFGGEFDPQHQLFAKAIIFISLQKFYGHTCSLNDIKQAADIVDHRTLRRVIDVLKRKEYIIEEVSHHDKRTRLVMPTLKLERMLTEELKKMLNAVNKPI